MKKIGIEINGVLRDTIGKITQLYEKHMIDETDDDSKTFEIDMSGNTEELVSGEEFEYKILSEVTSLNLINHFVAWNEKAMLIKDINKFINKLFKNLISTLFRLC